MICKKITIICLAIFPVAVTGENLELAINTYKIDDCVSRALKTSGVAINARTEQAVAHTRRAQARALALPHLSVEGSYTRLDEVQTMTLGDQTVELGQRDNYEVKGEISQLLYAGGQVGAALRAAGLAEKYAASARRLTETEITKNVLIAFSRVLLARETVSVHEKSISQLTSFLAATERKRKQDTVSEFDMLSARVRLANAQPLLIKAENNLHVAIEDLCRILNLESNQVEFAGKLEPLPLTASLESMLELAMTNSPALQGMEHLVALGNEDTISTRSDAYPRLTARAEYNGANSYNFASYEDDWEWHWNAGFVLSWNLWDGDLTRQKIKQKKLEYIKLVTDFEELRKTIRLQVRRAYLDMVHAQEAIDSSQDNVSLAEKALNIARTRYDAGVATHLDFTDSNLALTMARLEWFRSLHTLTVAVANLEYACGGNLKSETEKEK